jgi:hypothetical protein
VLLLVAPKKIQSGPAPSPVEPEHHSTADYIIVGDFATWDRATGASHTGADGASFLAEQPGGRGYPSIAGREKLPLLMTEAGVVSHRPS